MIFIDLINQYQSLNALNKRLVFSFLLAMLIALVVFLIVLPIHNTHLIDKEWSQKTQQELRWMRENSELVNPEKWRASPSSNIGLTLSVVLESAIQYQIPLSRYESGVGSLQIYTNETAYKNLIQWIHFLETTYSARIDRVQINKTETSAIVDATILFSLPEG